MTLHRALLPAFLFLLTNYWGISQNDPPTIEQSDPEARACLDRISDRIEKLQTLRIKFDITISQPDLEKNEHSGILLKKGGSYHISTGESTLISDGITLWTYLREINEVHITNVDAAEEGDLITPENLLQIHTSDQYLYSIMEKRMENGKSLAFIEFKPLKKDATYFKVRLIADVTNDQPQSIETFSRDGTRVLVSITDFTSDPNLSPDLFQFDPKAYPGVHIEDLRY